MAKLPRLERSNRLMVDAPQLQTPQFAEQVKTASTIKNALDKLKAFADKEAEEYVVEKAIEYSVDNPITLEQLQSAKESGINPIEQALNGGMVWNDALNKLYAQQASNELTLEMYNHYDNTLDKVNKGELNDKDLIKQELETPLKAWRDVIAQIDPAEAHTFYEKGIVSGSSSYKKALGTIRTEEQKRQDRINEGLKVGIRKEFELFMATNPNDPALIMVEYNNALDKAKSLFAGSAREQSYFNEITKNFSNALTAHIADSFVAEFSSEEEALSAIDSNKVTEEWSPAWKEFTETQRDHVRTLVVRGFSKESSRQSGVITKLDRDVNATIKRVTSGGDWSAIEKERESINTQINKETNPTTKESLLQSLAMLDGYISIGKELDGRSTSAQEYIVSKWEGLKSDMGKEVLKGLKSARGDDPVAFEVGQDSGASLGNIDLLLIPGDDFNKSMEPQLEIIDRNRAVFAGENKVFTKAQTAQAQKILSEGDSAEIITMAMNIAGNPHSDIMFKQVADKEPWFEVLGGLALSVGNEETIRKILEGRKLSKEFGVTAEKFVGSEAWRMVVDAYGPNHADDVKGIFEATSFHFINANNKGFDFTQKLGIVQDASLTDSLQVIVGRNKRSDGNYGGIEDVNNRNVILHEDINADNVEDMLQTATASDFDIGDHDIEAIHDAQLVRHEDVYRLIDVNGSELQLPNGRPIEVNLQDLQESYNSRIIYDSTFLDLLSSDLQFGLGTDLLSK